MRQIDADAMLTRLEKWNTSDSMDKALYNFALDRILEQPTIKPEPRWIPFAYHEENEMYVSDGKLPDDGQAILVTINKPGHEAVQTDVFYVENGEECHLDSGYDIVDEAVAWMPMPEAYKEGDE